MLRVQATKVLVSTAKSLVDRATKFDSADQNIGCPNPHHFLVDLIKSEGEPEQNFTLTQPNRYLILPTLTKGWKRLQKSDPKFSLFFISR